MVPSSPAAANRAAICQRQGSFWKPSTFENLHSLPLPHPIFPCGSHSFPPFKVFSLRKFKPHLFPLLIDANYTQGFCVASWPGWWATLWTSVGGKWQSRWLVHRLESRQALCHRHGRWGVWMVMLAPPWSFLPVLLFVTMYWREEALKDHFG